MKAIVFHEHGGPEVLKFEDVPEPKPKADEVLIKVRASGCNYNDVWARRGLPGLKVSLPHISGSDLAGEVADIGNQVSTVAVGDKVLIHPCLSCRVCEFCTSGREYFCRSFKIYGFETGPLEGGHADYAKLPQANVIPMPKRLSFEEAASIPLVFLTAWHMLVTRAGIQPGNTVLLLGAGSGLGIAGIQIAKLHGARVIATVGSDAKIEKAKKLGADEVLNHTTQDVAAEARRLTNKRGVDIVFEHVGEATWEKSILSLAYGGKIVTCGATTGYMGRTDLRHIFWKQLSILGSHEGSKAELLTVLRFVEEGKLKPVVDRVFPLEKAAEAQQLLESRQHFGKIVLTR